MKKTFDLSVKLGLVASSMLLGSVAYAADGWVNGDNMLEPGSTIHAISANASKNGYTSNPALNNNAWGMQGTWLSFEVSNPVDVLISLSSSAINAPGFTVYKTGDVFTTDTGTGRASTRDGGDADAGRVHSFNQVAQAGEAGLIWATDDSIANSLPGNTTVNGIVETLGYVNGSMTSFVNAWGSEIKSGAHDVSIDNKYESGVYGNIQHHSGPAGNTNYSNLTLVNLQPGYYTIFLGGTDTEGEDTPIDVKISGLPISVADCVLTHHEHNDMMEFPHGGLNSQTIATDEASYYYRPYASGNYLGISAEDDHLYSLDKEGVMTDLGDVATMATEAGCK